MGKLLKLLISVFASIISILIFQNCDGSGFKSGMKKQGILEGSEFSIAGTGTSSQNYQSFEGGNIKASLHFDGKVLTGFLCTNSLEPTINIIGDGNQRLELTPAYIIPFDKLNTEGKFLSGLCGQQKISYFSHRISSTRYRNPIFKINNRYPIDPNRIYVSKYFGIQYTTYHCPMSSQYGNERVFDVSKALEGESDWGPINWHHWVGEPVDGYYCLTRQKEIIEKHAILLKNAGIDYIYIDITNDPEAYWGASGSKMLWEFKHKIHQPVMAILETYRRLENRGIAVPKVVPWIGATTRFKNRDVPYNKSVSKWVDEEFDPASDGLRFRGFENKPLLFLKVANKEWFDWDYVKPRFDHHLDSGKYMPIVKWGDVVQFIEKSPERWSTNSGNILEANKVWRFFEHCEYNSQNQPVRNCRQDHHPKQISVSSAIPRANMTDENSLSKRRGRTFFQQFQGVFDSKIKYVSIGHWNNWLTNRYCHGRNTHGSSGGGKPKLYDFDDFYRFHCNRSGTYEFDSNGHPKFVDAFTYDYSRVMEPSNDPKYGDCYLHLMRSLVLNAKSNQTEMTMEQKTPFLNTCNFVLSK